MTGGLLGRSAEMSRLHQALATASDGSLAFVVIQGEAGIGKTTLMRAACAEAAASGFDVIEGRAEAVDLEPPFRTLADAFGVHGGKDQRRRAIRTALRSSSDEAMFTALEGFADLAQAEALASPTVLAIDDLQWVDTWTARGVAKILRAVEGAPFLLIATARPGPWTREVGALLRWQRPAISRVDLGPLAAAAVQELARGEVGGQPGPILESLIAGAEGNPFLVLEVIHAVAEGGALTRHGGIVETDRPASARAGIAHRIMTLGAEAQNLARYAAVLGVPFTAEHLADIAQVPKPLALDAVSALREAGVLADVNEALEFRHDLVREAVYEDMGPSLQSSLHLAVGWWLANSTASLVEAAGHLIRGSRPDDPTVVAWMIERSNDPELDVLSKIALYQRIIELAPDAEGHAERCLNLTRYLTWHGEREKSIAILEDLYEKDLSPYARLMTIENLAAAHHGIAHRQADRARWLEAAEGVAKAIPDEERTMYVRLLEARIAFYRGDLSGAVQIVDDLAASGALDGAAEPLNQASWMWTLAGRPAEGLRAIETALTYPHTAAGRPMYLRHKAWALSDLERSEEAERVLIAGRAEAERQRVPMALATVLHESAWLRYTLGQWDDARADIAVATDVWEDMGSHAAGDADSAGLDRWIEYRTGATSDSGGRGLGGSGDALAALHAIDRGDRDTALASVRAAIEHAEETSDRARHRHAFLPVITRIGLAVGGRSIAERALVLATAIHAAADLPTYAIAAARCAALLGNARAARRCVDLAASSKRKLIVAELLEDAAASLPAADARDALDRAATLFADMNAARDYERVGSTMMALGGRPTPRAKRPRVGWESLTKAERDVVRLAAEGLTNKEIGAKLFISHRTVGTHLAHSFDKLQVRSRVQLARIAAEHEADPVGHVD